jgi:hypothetical protein
VALAMALSLWYASSSVKSYSCLTSSTYTKLVALVVQTSSYMMKSFFSFHVWKKKNVYVIHLNPTEGGVR